jgi:hypothetical protein
VLAQPQVRNADSLPLQPCLAVPRSRPFPRARGTTVPAVGLSVLDALVAPENQRTHTVGTALRAQAGVENGASALGVTPAMMGIYGEHERDARNAAVLQAIQERLGNRRATFPNQSASLVQA